MTELLKAVTAYLARTGLPVYLAGQVPDGAAFPYAAYSLTAAPGSLPGTVEVTGWHRGEHANSHAAAFLDRLAELIPEEGAALALPDGRLLLGRGEPFMTMVTDGGAVGGRAILTARRVAERTVGSLRLGAGVFLLGLNLDGAASARGLREMIADALERDEQTLGMTTGGGWFRCVPALRCPGEDARRPPTIGGALLDGWVATLSGTLAELRPEHVAAVLPGARIARTGRVAELLLPQALGEDAYLPRLCWVGDTSGGLAAIELTGAMNAAGAAFHFVEGGEGTLPFEFRAHQAAGASGAPCRVVFLEE